MWLLPREAKRNCDELRSAVTQKTGGLNRKAGGPGTELERILGRFGIRPHKGCKCKRRATIMDHRGDEWCSQNINKIVGWMHEEAKQRRLPFSRRLAALLVKHAIKRSRNKQK